MENLYNKASLVLTPQMVETGKVYSMKPEDRKGDFTFSRSTAATRVNASGNIEKETGNLLVQSNQFDTSWEKSDVTITSGFVGYDGTNNAWELTRTATAYARMNQAVTQSGVYAHSIYAKAGTLNWISIGPTGGGEGTWFNLSNGTIGIEGSLIKHSSIESVGNGWYRISIVVNNPGNQWFRFYPSDVDGGDESATATGTIYVQDAQLEQGLVARDVITTTTTAIYGGITDNVPRLDYTDSSCPALLLEPQRTNLVTQSEYLLGYFATDGTTLSHNYGTSPEGVQNSVLITQIAGVASNSIYNFNLPTTDGSYTYSFFFKAGTSTLCRFYCGTGATENFNPQNVTAGYTGGSLNLLFEDYGSGWWRVSATQTLSGASTNRFAFNPDFGNNGGNVEIYGFQLEEASYATSYIPTYGSAVTRNRDNTSLTGVSDLLGQTEGTIYSEVRFPQGGSLSNWLSISAGNPQNWVFIGKDNDDIRGYVRASNSVIFSNQTFQIVDNALAKVAIAYKSGDIVLYINGTQISSSSTAFTFDATLNSIYFGSHDNGGTYETRKQNQVLLFKTRLSNEELATLTAI